MTYNDDKFMRNVRDARDNGWEMVCVECGMAVEDEDDFTSPDYHEMFCKFNADLKANQQLAARWATKQEQKP